MEHKFKKGAEKLKETYTKPCATVDTFSTVDVITTSSGGNDGKRDPIELPDL